MSIEQLYQIYLQYPYITTDSRNCPNGSLFIALKGDNFNGNKFAQQALEKGSAFAIVDELEFATNDKIILVDNCLNTLQELANYHRRQLKIPIIGITGTNGKTTTKELTAVVLSSKYNVLFTQGNLNNHIGVPLTILKINATHEIAVIEMGASKPGDIKELVNIAEPDFGIITNVGKAHLEGFGSFEGVIKTKGEMYDFIKSKHRKIFIHHENQFLQSISNGIEKIEYGENIGCFVNGKVTGNDPFLTYSWSTNGFESIVKTQLIGAYNLQNALAATAIGLTFNVRPDDISAAIEAYTPQNNRSQLTKTVRNTLIIDAYNANPSSMLAAINNFGQMHVTNKVLILGDMRELGDSSEVEHQRIVDLISKYSFNNVFLCGHYFKQTVHSFKSFETTTELIDYLTGNQISNCTILIKGSRGIQLEKTISLL